MVSPTAWAEVDLGAIEHNVGELCRIADTDVTLMAVVKANAYGHGIVDVSIRALQAGAGSLGVARIEEGIQLRQAGLDAPILILGHTPTDRFQDLFEYNLIQTVYSFEIATALSSVARKCGEKIRIHIKVDTGMGRLGIVSDTPGLPIASRDVKDNTTEEIEKICKLTGLDTEGIFTHFASADSAEKSYTKRQFDIFIQLLDRLKKDGLEIPVKHAANSAAIIEMPETHLDMVRAGISIYGLYPSADIDRSRIDLKPAMTFKSKIVQTKHVLPGFKVSYGGTYMAAKPTVIATVPIGYADGFNRLFSSSGCMLVRGQRAPVAGRVCMDLTMLDVGQIPDATSGDEVVVFGRQGDAEITVDELALALNSINYEVVCNVSERVERVYI